MWARVRPTLQAPSNQQCEERSRQSEHQEETHADERCGKASVREAVMNDELAHQIDLRQEARENHVSHHGEHREPE